MADDLELVRPSGIDPQAWDAITSHRDRLREAQRTDDRSLELGRAKELAECAARVVIAERGEVAPSTAAFPSLINSAHGVLERQPGPDLSNDPVLRQLMQASMKIVRSVGDMRNSFGSGHGRAREVHVEQEMVDVAVSGTMLWVRWALGRLEMLIRGQPTSLIRDLLGGEVFYKGQLAQRLNAANISELDASTQQKLGAAVAERAMRDTVLAKIEGVRACADSDSLKQWPEHYREGIVSALLFDLTGQARTSLWAIEQVPGLLAPMTNQAEVLRKIAELLRNQGVSTGSHSADMELWSAAVDLVNRFELSAQPFWEEITEVLRPDPLF